MKVTNPGALIVFSWLAGVELHSLIFSDHFYNCKRPLLKALVFCPVSKFDYKFLIICHDLHLLYVHFREYNIQDALSHYVQPSLFHHFCNIQSRLALTMIFTPVTVIILVGTCIKSITQYKIHLICENFKKNWLKIMFFELRDFLVAHVCKYSRLVLQESLS